MSNLYVDNIVEKTTGNGVHIPGHVIQFHQHRYSNEHTCQSSNAYQDVASSSFTFTPKSNNSKLFIESNVSVRINGDAQGCATRIVVDGVPYDTPVTSHEWYFNFAGTETADYYDRLIKSSYVDNTTTSARTIKLQVSNYNGDTDTRLNFSGRFQTVICVWEIAQ
jgi:hypothetical protein